jgi:hypothetical protein
VNNKKTTLLIGIPLSLLVVVSIGFNVVQFHGSQKQKEEIKTQNKRLMATEAKARKLDRKLQDGLAMAKAELSGRDSQILKLQDQIDGLQTTATANRQQVDEANKAAANAQAAAAQAQAQFQQAEQLTAQIPDLQSQLVAYQKLGTPKEIQTRLDQLANQKAAPAAPKAPVAPLNQPGQIGTILNHDPKFDFYVINAGTNVGIKRGDKYTIYRERKAVGRIQITSAQPNLSIAAPDRAFPNPPVAFKVGDRVMNFIRP